MIGSRPTGASVVIVETDAGEGYLKGLGNEAGPHALACELIGSLAADWLGLPTFDFSLVKVTEMDELDLAKGGRVAPGPAFISKSIEGSPWGGDAKSLIPLHNKYDLTKLVILDTWIRNCDRYSVSDGRVRVNRDNVFIANSKDGRRTVIAMDHTHAFTCGRDLTVRIGEIGAIRDAHRFGVFPEFADFWDLASEAHCLEKLASITAAVAESLVFQVPVEWEVDPRVQLKVATFLAERARWLSGQRGAGWLSSEG